MVRKTIGTVNRRLASPGEKPELHPKASRDLSSIKEEYLRLSEKALNILRFFFYLDI